MNEQEWKEAQPELNTLGRTLQSLMDLPQGAQLVEEAPGCETRAIPITKDSTFPRFMIITWFPELTITFTVSWWKEQDIFQKWAILHHRCDDGCGDRRALVSDRFRFGHPKDLEAEENRIGTAFEALSLITGSKVHRLKFGPTETTDTIVRALESSGLFDITDGGYVH